MKGRVYEVSLGDLNSLDSDFKKFRLICEDIQGRECLTNFHGMNFTRDKLCSIVRKWHSQIETSLAVRTSDGYLLRVFCIGFTKRDPHQIRKTTYAQSSKVRAIRKKMIENITREVTSSDLKTVVKKLIAGSIEKDIERKCFYLHPIENVFIRKVKVLKKPKFEHGRLAELHTSDGAAVVETGEAVSRPDDYEPPVQASV